MISGRSITGFLHLLNMTPVDWYSTLRTAVETVTFGSECVAARTAAEQILDLHLTLCYLGVPLDGRLLCLETTNPLSTRFLFPTPNCTSATMLLHYAKVPSGICTKG